MPDEGLSPVPTGKTIAACGDRAPKGRVSPDTFGTMGRVAGYACLVLAPGSLLYAILWRLLIGTEHNEDRWHTFNAVLVAAWVIGPPAWFWIQWFVTPLKPQTAEWDEFKHGQEVSRNLWVAVVALLAALLHVGLKG